MTRTIMYTLLILAALSPAIALAQIVSTTEADTDTGGNTVGSGGAVETGSAGSSVETSSVVGNGGGTVDIKIETKINGKVQTESIKKDIPSGGIRVDVSAKSSGGGGIHLFSLPTLLGTKESDAVAATPAPGASSVNIFRHISSSTPSTWGGFLPWFSSWFKGTSEGVSVTVTETSPSEDTEPQSFWESVTQKFRPAFWPF